MKLLDGAKGIQATLDFDVAKYRLFILQALNNGKITEADAMRMQKKNDEQIREIMRKVA